MMTVFVLIVLWLIVVVPMVLRRNDERRQERSVDGFGQAMRALGRRAQSTGASRPEVFVPGAHHDEPADVPTRRPVPAAQEALMYPVDRSEMSEARTAMMTRRRRSLTILGAGTVVFVLLGLMMGGLVWVLGLGFALGLGGYLYFLRSQALHDRERRLARQQRARQRRGPDVDATADIGYFETVPESVVRIDDDDIELHDLDTIDLTGLYTEQEPEPAQRRAS